MDLPRTAGRAVRRVLVVNAGSSSLKLRLVEGGRATESVDLAADTGRVDDTALRSALARLPRADAVGHRIVHGGRRFHGPVRLDDEVVTILESLLPLAPLHQGASLEAVRLVREERPDEVAVGCFDTGLFADMPAAASTYALPARWRERYGLHRYGFHGLSHGWSVRRVPELLGRDEPVGRLVSCHLGSGASVAAIASGRAVDTTMGFTPLEGLVMATRSGSVDPGLVTYLLRQGIGLEELDDALERHSGLVALAGTGDMRTLLDRLETGEKAAEAALGVYLHHLVAGVAAMAAALGGLDVLSFTGGVGERAAEVRRRAAARLSFLGVTLDEEANAALSGEGEVGAAGAAVRTVVVSAREDLEIARLVESVLDQAGSFGSDARGLGWRE